MPEPSRFVVVRAYGEAGVLSVAERPVPTVAAGGVRVRVEAAALAYADVMARRGVYPGVPDPPFTPGYSVVGRVESVGAGADPALVGRRVGALLVTGGYADHAVVPASDAVALPDAVDAAQAAALVLNYVTAYQMLHRVARVEAGQRVLVHGAAGGVGTALLELARIARVDTLGTASAGKHDLVRRLGAEPIDYAREDFVARVRQAGGADAAFDPIGAWHLVRSWQALRPGGVVVPYGAYTVERRGPHLVVLGAQLALAWLLGRVPGRRVAPFYHAGRWHQRHPDAFRDDLTRLGELLARGAIDPQIGARLRLEQAREAHRMLEERAVTGTIVLLPQAG